MSDGKRKTVYLSPQNYRALKDTDNASAVVDRLVDAWRETGDTGKAAIESQLNQKRRELEDEQRSVKRLKKDIAELEALKRDMTNVQETTLEEAQDALAETPRDPTNEAIKTWAGRLELTPTELVDRLD